MSYLNFVQTVPVFAEKICDYFEKVELKTGKNFEKVVEKYTLDFDSIVGDRVEKEPKPRKGEPTPPTPRARKYYDRACFIRKNNKDSERGLLDYSRLMFCLYMSIINNSFKKIEDLDFAFKSLNLTKMLEAMCRETTLLGRKSKFDIKDPYSSDRSTFVITVIMFYYMKSKEVIGEY